MLSRLYRYGQWPNSHDLLKTLALLLMIVDHVGAYVLPQEHWLRIIGRGSAPLFFFLVGYFPPKAPERQLLIYGVLLTLLNYATDHLLFLDILCNFAVIKIALVTFEQRDWTVRHTGKIVLCLLLLNPFVYYFMEYGTSGLLFALSARLIVLRDPRATGYLLIALINHFFYEYFGLIPYMHLPQEILFACVELSVCLLLFFYHLREWKTPIGTRTVILFLSRYSLAIYFWHLAILKIWHFWHYHYLNLVTRI